jgi:hydroxyethylthiazole kinase
MAAIASGVYINTGLHETQPASLQEASRAILELKRPAVLDPVGAGATEYRTGAIEKLLAATHFHALRGNASEVRALAGGGAGPRGVDSSDSADSARDAALLLARTRGCVVAVSGERDLITDGEWVARIAGGHPWLALITGSGCALGALNAACVAATGDAWAGTLAAHAAFALAADRAVQRSAGPGTLSIHFLDELAALRPSDFSEARLSVEQARGDLAGRRV